LIWCQQLTLRIELMADGASACCSPCPERLVPLLRV
jgi:hypothetical protein